MRAFVFTDKALARHAGQFVWLSIDTEKPGNASFLTKFPVEVWPSFYVVDSRTEKVALRWVGGALHGRGGAERVEEFPRLRPCVDRARRDRVDPDAARAVLRRPRLGE